MPASPVAWEPPPPRLSDRLKEEWELLTVTQLWPNMTSVPGTPGQSERLVGRDEEVATISMTEEARAGGVSAAEGPDGQPAARRARCGEVRVFGQWCKGCGLCIVFCPRNVFATGADGRPLALYPERCTACMWCVEHCPDFAIRVEPASEVPGRRDAA